MTIIWSMVPQILSTIDRIFYPPPHPNNPKKTKFQKKIEKCLEILSFYTCVPWMIIIWCMIPDIWSATDRIFLSFWTTFCLFIILMTQEIKILKNKKTPGEIIILHKCIINDNHMMYGSWYMKHDGQNFLSFWTVFGPFTPLTTKKIKILKNWKKLLEILSFYTCIP